MKGLEDTNTRTGIKSCLIFFSLFYDLTGNVKNPFMN